MNRLEKKCLLASASLHGLLVVVFLVGSAFFTPKAKQDSLPILSFVPDKLVDQMLFGGGNPNVQPQPLPPPRPLVQPQPQPQPPQVQPQPKPQPKPQPEKPEPQKEPDHKRLGDEPVPVKSKKTDTSKADSRISTNVVKRAKVDPAAVRAEQEAREQAREYAQFQKRLAGVAKSVSGSVSELGSSLSGSTVSVVPFGPGGYAFANYGQWVKSVYDHAWVVSADIADDDSKVRVRITIARDGAILSARIIAPSSNRALNRSVQGVLDDVKTIGKPFPEGAREDQRTFEINFNLKAKRQLG